jgi:hypothetical protein
VCRREGTPWPPPRYDFDRGLAGGKGRGICCPDERGPGVGTSAVSPQEGRHGDGVKPGRRRR